MKCLILVNAIAILYLFALLITSISLTDPPGWIIAFTPNLPKTSILSGNGKNASEATKAPFKIFLLKNFYAFSDPIFAESSLFIWPAPIPIELLFLT